MDGSMSVVVLVGQNTLVSSRIKNIFADQNMKIYEAYSRRELSRILFQNSNIDLILTEMEIDTENGFNGIKLIQQVKAQKSGIPVVMLSSIGKREVITRCLREGAVGYILKPFKDEYLKEKLLKLINVEKQAESPVLQFDLKGFLEGEIHKAKKGNYCFSLLKIQFDTGVQYAESLYNEMKSLFWESDLYIQHGYQCHLGFFPFCDQKNGKLIIDKIESRFKDYKLKEPNTKASSITYTFSSYPTDGETVSELLNNLSMNITIDMKTA